MGGRAVVGILAASDRLAAYQECCLGSVSVIVHMCEGLCVCDEVHKLWWVDGKSWGSASIPPASSIIQCCGSPWGLSINTPPPALCNKGGDKCSRFISLSLPIYPSLWTTTSLEAEQTWAGAQWLSANEVTLDIPRFIQWAWVWKEKCRHSYIFILFIFLTFCYCFFFTFCKVSSKFEKSFFVAW